MFFRTIFVCLVGFVLVKSAESHERTDRLNITFKITSTKFEKSFQINCDHNNDDKLKNIYTVREGEEFTIITKYNSYINHFSCSNYNDYNDFKYSYAILKKGGNKNVTTIKVEKRMGTLWNCTLLANLNNPKYLPVVPYKGDTYSAAYCYMKIHVRQTSSPQTILVNNMVLQAKRTDLSETKFDFIAEYQYVDGDVVNVTCANLLNPANLMMEYAMAGTMSDHSTMSDLSSANAIGFVATLHSEHDKSFMICTNTENTDYTKVMVRFMRTEFKNIVSIKINGMTLRPKLKNVPNNLYEIEYKYVRNQLINVVCEVQRTDVKLVVADEIDFADLIPDKKAKMSFFLNSEDEKKFECGADYNTGGSAERVFIRFTAGNFPIEQYPLHMELPSNGTVMELYNDNKLKVIHYEFQDGETLQLKCGPLPYLTEPGPPVELQIILPDKMPDPCKTTGCVVSETFRVTRVKYENATVVCYLKEKISFVQYTRRGYTVQKKKKKVFKEIRVILRERVLTTTSTTTSTTSTTSTTTNPVSDSPQTILVNNMVLQAVRTDLSEKDVDFTAEYQYADGDVVNVTCTNLLNPAPLTMEYAMAATMSDNSIMKELSSNEAIGFRVKLHSGHNNSYMICTHTEPTDYTKVMVRFVMRTEINKVSVSINGMTLRPQLFNYENNHYDIEYKYPSHQHINVVCEVQRTDMNLVVEDRIDFVGKVSSYKKRELIPTKTAEMSFSLKPMDSKKLLCACDNIHGGSAERVSIHFTAGNFLTDQYPLHMELPSNGTVMELYSDDKLKIIFYEFEDGETLQLKCGPLFVPSEPGPAIYLQFKDFDICNQNGCAISKILNVTHKDENTEITCYIKDQKYDGVFSKKDKIRREIRVILRERVPASSETSNNLTHYNNMYAVAVAVTVAVFIVILIILYLSVKKRSCCIGSSSQELPAVPTPRPEPGINYYENMLAIFKPINDREAAEMEPQYEEIQ